MTNVLVVCTANVCRSPMAEALLGRAVRSRGSAATLGSAGTEARPGVPAARGAVAAMSREGLDLSGHRSRSADDAVVDAADLVLTMEAAHVAALVGGHPDRFARVLTLGEFVELADEHGGRGDRPLDEWLAAIGSHRSAAAVLTRTDLDVADPIGGTRRAFRRCAARLERDCERAATALWGPADALGSSQG